MLRSDRQLGRRHPYAVERRRRGPQGLEVQPWLRNDQAAVDATGLPRKQPLPRKIADLARRRAGRGRRQRVEERDDGAGIRRRGLAQGLAEDVGQCRQGRVGRQRGEQRLRRCQAVGQGLQLGQIEI